MRKKNVLKLTLLALYLLLAGLPTATAESAATAEPTTTAEPASETEQPAVEASFIVVVSASNPLEEIRSKDASRIFLKKARRWPDGEPILAVDQASSSPVRQAFTAAVHGKNVRAVLSLWQRMIFSGRDVPPPELGTDQAVLRHVGSHPGGIGYVRASTPLGPDVKALTIVGL